MKRVLTENQKRKKRRGLCIFNRCLAKAGRPKIFCHKHHARDYKSRHPIRYLYNIKKQRAKERGIAWAWSFEDFRDFVKATGYMEKRGRLQASMTIDRIDPRRGYAADNVQILTHSENSSKGATVPEELDEVPF